MAAFDSPYKYLKKDYKEIKNKLIEHGYSFPKLPQNLTATTSSGESFSKAYPIQGILKYHGFVGNPENRIAYFPSISLNNTAASTITYLAFDDSLKDDLAVVNGTRVYKDKLHRIKLALDFIRRISQISTKALLISRNYFPSQEKNATGKGIGTSASASAALALAAASIIYQNNPEQLENSRLMSIFSRYLSGSGCRSASGGISLWLSHPQIDPLDCYALRLDTPKYRDFINEIALLTIPIESDIKTHQAHEIAPLSPYFPIWLKQRKSSIFKFLNALNQKDFNTIGEIAEYDTNCLHSITMTAPKRGFIAWKPETLKIMEKVKELREKENFSIYYSIDTGPTVVLLTLEKDKRELKNRLKESLENRSVLEGKIGGPSTIMDSSSEDAKLLQADIQKYRSF
ncbi:MAG: hypothetical protein EU544_00445 [Promethearchaeota archaeon]|nr:MAG: hypothetical protein EU544_00445 [Candidatus Lokiarchaeota archaeon]